MAPPPRPARPKTTARPTRATAKRALDADQAQEANGSPSKKPRGRPLREPKQAVGTSNRKSVYDIPSDDDPSEADDDQDQDEDDQSEDEDEQAEENDDIDRRAPRARRNLVPGAPVPTARAARREDPDDAASSQGGGAEEEDGVQNGAEPAQTEDLVVSDHGSTQQATPRRRKTLAGRATGPAMEDDSRYSTPRDRKRARGGNTALPETPKGGNGVVMTGETPRWRRNDRSARKKSARALIERIVTGEASDEGEDEDITRAIYESADDDDDDVARSLAGHTEEHLELDDNEVVDATPSKKPRGRPRQGKTTAQARKPQRSPTPPRDLPPHEQYFAQNRPGAHKTSDNSLASLELLSHDEYFSILRQHTMTSDRHGADVDRLQSLHARSFPQWHFELSQGFSVCLYGYGSKRPLLHRFAGHLYRHHHHQTSPDHSMTDNKIVIVNGYVRSTTARDVLGTVGRAVQPSYKLPAGNAAAMLEDVKAVLTAHDDVRVTVVLNSIDAAPLRRPGLQAVLSELAAQPSVRLICSADTPDFALLWDGAARSAFNFAFHDCTTFAPFGAEVDVVDHVHDLLGRTATRVGGRDGVTFVLRSLPENARGLFRLLVGEVLVAMDDDAAAAVSAAGNPGIEYRILYNKAVEEFICSSEMAFRTLLKEFHDHQMITSRKDALGTELLSAPFRKEELESILEDLTS